MKTLQQQTSHPRSEREGEQQRQAVEADVTPFRVHPTSDSETSLLSPDRHLILRSRQDLEREPADQLE